MDNWDEFKKDASLVEELSKVTNFLKEKMNLDWVDERSVARAYGVMKTNAMALKDEGGQALFPIASRTVVSPPSSHWTSLGSPLPSVPRETSRRGRS